MTKKTLSPEDWIKAGLRALARGGPAALRAEAIARDLATTKGSFYWHFKDLPAYKSAILDYWQRRATAEIIAAVKTQPNPQSRLNALIELATTTPSEMGGPATESAIREWARQDCKVAQFLARIDAERLDFLRQQLQHLRGEADQHARLIYAAHLGLELLSSTVGCKGAKDLQLLLCLLSR